PGRRFINFDGPHPYPRLRAVTAVQADDVSLLHIVGALWAARGANDIRQLVRVLALPVLGTIIGGCRFGGRRRCGSAFPGGDRLGGGNDEDAAARLAANLFADEFRRSLEFFLAFRANDVDTRGHDSSSVRCDSSLLHWGRSVRF